MHQLLSATLERCCCKALCTNSTPRHGVLSLCLSRFPLFLGLPCLFLLQSRLPSRASVGLPGGVSRTTCEVKGMSAWRLPTDCLLPFSQSRLPSRASVGLPEGCIIYSCSNQLYKYDPETFDTWCNILRHVPNRCDKSLSSAHS